MYASEELSRLKRIGLLYTKAALTVFFACVLYIKAPHLSNSSRLTSFLR